MTYDKPKSKGLEKTKSKFEYNIKSAKSKLVTRRLRAPLRPKEFPKWIRNAYASRNHANIQRLKEFEKARADSIKLMRQEITYLKLKDTKSQAHIAKLQKVLRII